MSRSTLPPGAAAFVCSFVLSTAVGAPAAEPELVSTGLPATDVAVHGSHVVFENQTSSPFLVELVHYDAATGESAAIGPFGLISFPLELQITDERVAFLASEGFSRLDLNGDGDMEDYVPHAWDFATGTLASAALSAGRDAGLNPRPTFGFTGRYLLFSVSERHQHEEPDGVDLNGDGDKLDSVLHVLDAQTGVTTNLGVSTLTGGRFAVVAGRGVALVTESQVPVLDRNGDGDTLDTIPMIYDPGSGALVDVGVSADGMTPGPTGLLALNVSEADEGRDLNGDGDETDIVVMLYDPEAGSLETLPLAAGSVAWAGRFLAIEANEFGEQRDLNGDDDQLDQQVLHVYDTATGVMRNLGLATTSFTSPAGERFVFAVREDRQGETDINGDGDATDNILHVYDAATQTLRVTDTAVAFIAPRAVFDAFAALFVPESANGEDLNGDGDETDLVFGSLDIASGVVTNLGLAGGTVIATANRFLLSVSEFFQGETDLNGDGDAFDLLLYFVEPGSAPEYLGLGFPRSALSQDALAVAARESEAGEDLNGDTDLDDTILMVARFGPPPPEEQIEELIEIIEDLDMKAGVQNAFLAKLEAALQSLEGGNVDAAIGSLNALRNQLVAQSGKAISEEEAEALIARIDQILAALEG